MQFARAVIRRARYASWLAGEIVSMGFYPLRVVVFK